MILCVIFSLLCVFPLFSDEREENIDIFVVLDKSLSMVEEIDPVKNYVIDTLIEETLIPGDRFVVIQFYGKAEILIADDVAEEGKKLDFANMIASMKADGSYTDIGNALDKLKAAIGDYEHPDRRKYLLLITDGKQEAPEDSKYYSPDGQFNHAFLENVKTIQKEGWKIQVLGIGTASAAKELAEQLSGGYVETSEEPTQEEITEKTGDLFGLIEISSPPRAEPLGKKGNSVLTLPLSVQGYSEQQEIVFNRIVIDFEASGLENEVLAEGGSYTLPDEGTKKIEIPFSIEQDLAPGTYDATLSFTFRGLTVFTPSQADITIEVKGFFGNNIWLIPVIAVIFLALAGAIVLLVLRMNKNKPCEFRLYIDMRPAQAAPISLGEGESIYLDRDGASYTTAAEKGEKTLGVIKYSGGKLKLQSLNSTFFTLPDDLPDSVLGEKIVAKAKSGLKKELYFKAV